MSTSSTEFESDHFNAKNFKPGIVALNSGDINESFLGNGYYTFGEQSLMFFVKGAKETADKPLSYYVTISDGTEAIGHYTLQLNETKLILEGGDDEKMTIPTQLLERELNSTNDN